jgi:hypothetical protein
MPRMGADPTGHSRGIRSANRRPVQPSTAPSAIGRTICLALGSLALTNCSNEVREPPQIEPRPAVYPPAATAARSRTATTAAQCRGCDLGIWIPTLER